VRRAEAMSSMWGTQSVAGRINPETLHTQLVTRLEALESLLPRLSKQEEEVSQRDLMQARSRTALSCRLDARLLSAGSAAAAGVIAPLMANPFFSQPELLEHTLSFLTSPEQARERPSNPEAPLPPPYAEPAPSPRRPSS
jgi:hypothetical protein